MSTDETEQKTRVRAAWLRIERSHGFVHPVLRFGSADSYEKDDGETFSYAGSMDSRYRMRKPYPVDLEDFEVTAQGDQDKPGELYAWSMEYKKYRVEASAVAGMAKTFATLRRHLDKAKTDAGDCAAWADYALRICTALKIDRLYVRLPDHVRRPEWNPSPVRRFDGGSQIRDGLAIGERQLWTDEERERATAAA